MGDTTETPAEKGAIKHLKAGLKTEDTEEANYHIKEALQLLNVDEHPGAVR